jgi:predicted tellurium resistance membrane protein TerC
MSSRDIYLMLLDFVSEVKSFTILSAILFGIVFIWTGWIMFNLWLEERVKALYAKNDRREEEAMGKHIEHQFDDSKKQK